jgi:hypothetical protein
MKKINFKHMKRVAILLFLSLVVSFSLPAKEKIEKVLVDKKFEVNKGALLQIDHQYGTVECKNWDQGAISVKVIARIETSNPDKARRIFDAIKINLDGNKNEVSLESDINNSAFKNGNNNISIDIEIFMPASVNLNLEHEFGNAYVEIVEGDAEISIEYGSLEINELKSENNSIEIGFGNADIAYVNKGDIEINYSNVEIGKSVLLSIENDYSNLSIDKVGELEIENEGGQIEIGKVDKVSLSSKFSDFKIGELITSLSGETEYGSLSVKKIRADFTFIEVENSFGSVSMYFDPECTFDIVAEMEFCTLNYPDEVADFSKRIVSSTTDSYYEGTFGNGPGKGSKVEISSEYGGFSIYFR